MYGFGNMWIVSGMDGWPWGQVYGFGNSWVILEMGGWFTMLVSGLGMGGRSLRWVDRFGDRWVIPRICMCLCYCLCFVLLFVFMRLCFLVWMDGL